MTSPRTPRLVMARRSVLAGATVSIALGASAHALWADEGGEAGEGAAIAELPDAVQFLTVLGLFEAQHRIVADLYALGDVVAAQAHLAESHHAFYEDLEEGIGELGATGFQSETEGFANAVTSGADAGSVKTAGEAVFAAITSVRKRAHDKDQIKAAEALLRVAASDIEAGVDAGQVTLPQEYRDAWGFATVATLWLDDLAADQDATVAAAAKSALAGKADVAAQFAGVDAKAAPGDPAALLAAAARVELAAYRLK